MHGLWRKAEVPGQGSPHHESKRQIVVVCFENPVSDRIN